MILEPPIYRLTGGRKRGYYVNVWLGGTEPGFDPDDDWSPAHTIDVARTTTRAAAYAVLRLFGVSVFHDWTKKGANWDMPLRAVPDQGKTQ